MKMMTCVYFMLINLLLSYKAFAQASSTFQRKGYTLTFTSNAAHLDTALQQRLVETFFKVYPKIAKTYNKQTLKTVTFFIDTAYKGVAATSNGRVVFNPQWFQKHPEDIDVVTHEVMHIAQDYKRSVGPGWLTEGIADYVRYQFGVNNEASKWSLPVYKTGQSYTNSYRITASFLRWLEKNQKKGIVKELDKQLRDHTYTTQTWQQQTGKTLDELWVAYNDNPGIE